MNDRPKYQKELHGLTPEQAFELVKNDLHWESDPMAIWYIDKDGYLCERVFQMWQKTKTIKHSTLRRKM